jgi:hypothetical protein
MRNSKSTQRRKRFYIFQPFSCCARSANLISMSLLPTAAQAFVERDECQQPIALRPSEVQLRGKKLLLSLQNFVVISQSYGRTRPPIRLHRHWQSARVVLLVECRADVPTTRMVIQPVCWAPPAPALEQDAGWVRVPAQEHRTTCLRPTRPGFSKRPFLRAERHTKWSRLPSSSRQGRSKSAGLGVGGVCG